MFVKVNNRIVDYYEYLRQVNLVKNHAETVCSEALAPHGFKLKGEGFHHEKLDLYLMFRFSTGRLKRV